MQVTEAHLSNHRTAVNANTTEGLCYPYRITSENLVVLRCTSKFDQSQLHNEVVNELLNLLLCESTVSQISLSVDIKESRCTAKGHSSTVLLFHCTEVAKISSLNSLLYVSSRFGNVTAIRSSHFFHKLQGNHLFRKLFAKTDYIVSHNAACGILLIHFVFNQSVNTIQGNTSVVTDDTATAISIRKTCDNVRRTASSHFCIICIETTCVVCLSVSGEELADLRINFVTIVRTCLLCHSDTAIRLKGTLKRLIGLETYDCLFALVKIARAVGCNGRNYLGVHVKHTASLTFLLL